MADLTNTERLHRGVGLSESQLVSRLLQRGRKNGEKRTQMDAVTRQLAQIQFSALANSLPTSDAREICKFMASALEGKESVESMRTLLDALAPLREAESCSPAMNGLVSSAVAYLTMLCAEESKRTFIYFPEIEHEVRGVRHDGLVAQGRFATGYGTSMYEFHYEYPITGAGCPKNTIVVLVPDREPVPIFDYCRENSIVVVCNRCGEEITYTVDMECAYRKQLAREASAQEKEGRR